MKPIHAVLSSGEKVLDRVLCVAGAVLFSQAPEFMQQYLQRLGGHLDEARRQLAQFQAVAKQSGLTLERLINQTLATGDPAVAKLGGVMQSSVARVDELTAAHAALVDATVFTRPFVFARYLDAEIGRATAEFFKPAVPTTLEGGLYACAGMGVLLAVYYLGIKKLATRVRWPKRRTV